MIRKYILYMYYLGNVLLRLLKLATKAVVRLGR